MPDYHSSIEHARESETLLRNGDSLKLSAVIAAVLPLLEQMSEGIQIFDVHGCLVYANAAVAHSLGFKTGQAFWRACQGHCWGAGMVSFGQSDGTGLAIDDYPWVRALQGKEVGEEILSFVDQNHRDRCLAVRALPLRDEAGTVQYSVALSRDLTEAETANARNYRVRQLHQLADVVPSWVAGLNRQECHVYANEAYLKAFGATAETIQGNALQAVVGPVVYQQLHSALAQAWRGEAADLCLPLGHRQTRLQYKHVSVIPQFDEQAVTGLYLVVSDIAAHQHTTDLLQNETDFFRHSPEAAAVGIWDWHFGQHEMMWSSPQEQLFGLTPGSFDGQPETFLGLVHADDRDGLEAAIANVTQPRQQFAAEFRVVWPDQSIRWLSQRGQVLRDPVGNAVCMVGVTFDVTAQRDAQELLVRQMRRDRLIAKLSQDISRSEQIEQTLPEIFEAVRDHLNLDRLVLIDLRQSAGKVVAEAQVPEMESMLDWKMRHPWSVKAAYLEKFKLGYPIGSADVLQQSLSESELSFLDFFHVRADLSLPLLDNDQLWGLFSAQSQQPREWQLEEKRFLETIGMLVSTAIQRDRLHHYLMHANRKLKRFAYLDGLTRVANRRRFEHFLHQEWRRLMREQSSMALIMVDIDHFKAYNDVYGHQAGDDCLRRVAGILRSAIQRPADIVARYGGEEFALVLPNTNVEGAETIAKKIKILIHRAKIPHEGSLVSKHITISLGIAVMYPHPLKSPDDLVKNADQALYQAKAAGRDRVVVFSSKTS